MSFPPLQPAAFYRLSRKERKEVIQRAARGDLMLLLSSMLPVIAMSVAGPLTYVCYRELGGGGFMLPMFTSLVIWGAIFGAAGFRFIYCPRLARKIARELEAMNPTTPPESKGEAEGAG